MKKVIVGMCIGAFSALCPIFAGNLPETRPTPAIPAYSIKEAPVRNENTQTDQHLALPTSSSETQGHEKTDPTDKLIVSNLYRIEGIQMDISATSAQEARNLAIQQAQRKAFLLLLERLIPEHERGKFSDLNDGEIESTVQDFEVSSEKITRLRYIATFNIRFDPVALEKIVGGNKIEIQPQVIVSPETVIIPLFRQNQKVQLWDGTNPWFEAWTANPSRSLSIRAIIPVGDLEDIQDISVRDALSGNAGSMERIIRRYNATQALVAFLMVDPEGTWLELHRLSTDGIIVSVGPIQLSGPEQDPHKAINMAFSRFDEMITELNRKEKLALTPQIMELHTRFNGLPEWVKTKKILEGIPGVKSVTIKNLGRLHADIIISHSQSQSTLNEYMASFGMIIESTKDGKNILSYAHESQTDKQEIQFSKPQTGLTPQEATSSIPSSQEPVSGKMFKQRVSPYYMPSEVLRPGTDPEQQPVSPLENTEGGLR